MRTALAAAAAGLAFCAAALGADAVTGWRGNWTGRFPDATPPTTWERRCTSPVSELLYSARKPKGDETAGALKPMSQSVVSWLVLGPFTPKDPKSALDESFLPDEAAVAPDEGDKAGDLAWTAYSKDSIEQQWQRFGKHPNYWSGVFNEALDKDFSDHLDFATVFPKGAAGVAYAHAWLYSPRAGAVELLLNHAQGMKILLNGKTVYANPGAVLAQHATNYSVARYEWHTGSTKSVRLDLAKGWNRLLLKVVGGKAWSFDLRLTAPADARYESKNILWETPLPAHGHGNPIVMGDRVFLTCEPDELVCIDRKDGKILWRRTNTLFDAVPPEERAANPAFKDLDPIVAAIAAAKSYPESLALRGRMNAILKKIDPARFAASTPGVDVGCATPNVCGDGKHAYVYFTHGVAACYDLDGRRQWIQLLTDITETGIGNQSPALSGGAFIVQRQHVRAFDKATGKVLWTTELKDNRCGSTVPAKVGGTDVVIVNFSQVLRSSDGKILAGKRAVHHITPAVVEGNVVIDGYDGQLAPWRLDSLAGDALKVANFHGSAPGTPADSLSSYLWDRGFVYMLDSKGILVVWELNDRGVAKPAWHQAFGEGPGRLLRPLFEPPEYGCVASPMLAGKNVYLLDNQGATVVVESGGAYQRVAVNRIENYLPRGFVTNTQERFTASPVADGPNLFIRGEDRLYCIGETK